MARRSLRVSKKYGVNPALCSCPWCGKDNGQLVLLGATSEFKCTICHGKVIGERRDPCPHCQARHSLKRVGEYDASRGGRVPGGLCKDCEAKKRAVDEEVRAGGIHWKCKDCNSAGAIKAGHPLALKVRAHFKIEPPGACGVEFTKAEGCPVCGQE
jgi:rubrerythrin